MCHATSGKRSSARDEQNAWRRLGTRKPAKDLRLPVNKQSINPFSTAHAQKYCVMDSTSATSSKAVRTLHSIVFCVWVERTQMPFELIPRPVIDNLETADDI